MSAFEHKTSGFHTLHVFIHFYRYIHAAIVPGSSVSIFPGDQQVRHIQDIFCQQLHEALCHHAAALYHEETAPLSFAALFSSAGIFPDKRNWSPLVSSFEACKKISSEKQRHAWIKPSQLHLEAADKLLLIGISLLCIVFALVATLHKVILQNRLQLQKLQT